MNLTSKSSQPTAPKENIHSVLLSIINSLKKRHENRRESEINALIFAFRNFPYLRNIFDKYGQCAETLILKNLKYIKLDKNSTILPQGRELEAYYIILDGVIEFTGPDDTDAQFCLPEGPHAPKSYCFGEWPKPEPMYCGLEVTCRERSELAVITHQNLREIIHKGKVQKKISFIGCLPFSKGFTEYRISTLLNCFQLHKYRRNDVIFGEREIGEHIYIVKKGEIKLYKKVGFKDNMNAEKDTVSPLQISRQKSTKSIDFLILGKGQIFGDEILHGDSIRQASALCSSAKASVYRISIEDFKQHFLLNQDNKQNLQKFYDSKVRWREGHLHEIKQSSAGKNKSFDNKDHTPVKSNNRAINQIYYSSFEKQPQLKALQRQMRMSIDSISSFTNNLNSSEATDTHTHTHTHNTQTHIRPTTSEYSHSLSTSNNTAQAKKSKNVRASLKAQENSLKGIVSRDNSCKENSVFKPILKQRNKSSQSKNGQKINEYKPQVKSLADALQDRIVRKLNTVNRVNRLPLSPKKKNVAESSLLSLYPTDKTDKDKENNTISIQSLKEEFSFIYSLQKIDLFQQSQRMFNECSQKDLNQKEFPAGSFRPKKQRYCRSNQTSLASLGNLTDLIIKNPESVKVSPTEKSLANIGSMGHTSVSSNIMSENNVMEKLVNKELPVEKKCNNTAKLNSDLINYHLAFKYGTETEKDKLNRVSRNMKRRVSRVKEVNRSRDGLGTGDCMESLRARYMNSSNIV